MESKSKPTAKPEEGSQKLGDRDPQGANSRKVQGEGDYEAARKYDADQAKFNASGKIEEKAREAEQAFEGKEGDELRRAEEEGKRHSHGEDPLLEKQKH